MFVGHLQNGFGGKMIGGRSARTLVTVVIFFAAGFGQSAGQTALFVRGGASLSSFAGDDVASADTRVGVRAGAGATFRIASNLSVLIGVAYTQKGATLQSGGGESGIEIDYLEVPLLLRIEPVMEGPLTPHFSIGPAIAFEVNCDRVNTSRGSVPCSELLVEVEPIDFGGTVEAGLDMTMSENLSISLDVLYNIGFKSIDASTAAADVKNRGWSILAGVGFPLG